MTEQNAEASRRLVDLLKQNSAVLMAGAGCSRFCGYPSWNELVEEMRGKLAPSMLVRLNESPEEYADSIKNSVRDTGQMDDYYNFLQERFGPRNPAYDAVHLTLVRLPFRGIVTTNYDPVLESAMQKSSAEAEDFSPCEPIDLCQDRHRDVFVQRAKSPFQSGSSPDCCRV